MQRSAWLLPFALILGCATTSPSPSRATEAPTSEEQATPAAKTVLGGTMTSASGQPLKLAHVRLTSSARGTDGKPSTQEVEVGSDGTFSLEAQGDGYHELEVTAVDHAQHTFGLLLDGETHELSLELGTYPRPSPGEKLTARGHFKGEHKGKPITFELTKSDSGRYVATVERPAAEPAKTEAAAEPEPTVFRYQITDLTSVGRTVNGTQADRFEYDGGGDYWAVLPAPAPGEKLEIEFDPAAMPKAGTATEVQFGDPTTVLARVATLSAEFAATDKALNDRMRSEIASFEPAKPGQEIDAAAIFGKLRSTESEAIVARLETEEDPVVRRILLVRWAGLIHVPERDEDAPTDAPAPTPEGSDSAAPSPALATAVLEEVSAIDPLWSLSPGGIHSVVLAAGQGHPPDAQKQLHAYEDEAIAEHPDVNIGASLLLSRLSRAAKTRDMEAARVAKKELQSDRFKGTRSAKMMIWFDPERPLAAGNKVPAFEVSSLDGKRSFTPSDFEGKILVLDFWATWCGPCKADMPVMHAAYAKANGKKARKDKKYRRIKSPRVEFLSISFDAAVEDPKKYHAAEWPMPWNHAFVSPDDAGTLREELGIMGIPTLVVVDADGTIIASTPNMNGGKLDATLTELLAKQKNRKPGRKPEEVAAR